MPRWEAETPKPEMKPALKPVRWMTQAARASWTPGNKTVPCSSINLWMVVWPGRVDMDRIPFVALEACLATEVKMLDIMTWFLCRENLRNVDREIFHKLRERREWRRKEGGRRKELRTCL